MGFWLLAHARRPRHPAELVAREAGHECHVERIVRGKRALVHRLRDAPPPAELHRPDIHLVHFRGGNRAVALLNQRTGYASPAELSRKGEPDWTTTDNQDRGTLHQRIPLN
jgi:hypothetical protein